MVESRTLRCANAMLYAGFTLIVWAAAAYVIIFRDYGLYGYLGAGSAALITLLWGGYYMTLRYEIDSTGITRRGFGSCIRIGWSSLTRAELHVSRTTEITNAVLHLESPTCSMDIGSDLFTVDAVQDLAQDFDKAGLLTPPLTTGSGEGDEGGN